MIEINVKVTPNKKAKPYHKNNMLLMVTTYIDMEDAYSLDAPGSQLQSIGSKKAVVFSALPGEEKTFTIRIGTDSFESQGIIMMMPGTLEQLKSIKELKEAKDTLEDSGDAIYSSMNEILATMESMNSGLAELKSGTIGLEHARSIFSAGKGRIYEDFDQTLEDLNAINNQLQNLIPYFTTCQKMIRSINNDIEDITDALDEYEGPLNNADNSITAMQAALTALGSAMNTLNTQMNNMLTNMAAGAAAGDATQYDIAELQGQAAMATTLGNYMDKISSLLTETVKMGNTVKDIIDITNDLIGYMDEAGNTFNKYEDDLIDLLDEIEQLTILVNSSLSSTIAYMSYSKSLLQQTDEILDPAMEKTLKAIIDLLEKSLQNKDDIAALRRANSTVKSTIDEQFSKFEDENRFLYLDPEAPLESFTSDKNPPPASLQVILRTQEINLDSIDEINDLENGKENKGLLARIIDIFIEIKEKIANIL